MVFAGVGAMAVAENNDAAAKEPELIDHSIVVKDSMAVDYANEEGNLYMLITADLYLEGDARVAAMDEHLTAFAGAIWTYYDEASLVFEIPYKITEKGKTIADVVPASFLVYFTDELFILPVEKAADFTILSTIMTYTTGEDAILELGAEIDVTVSALVAIGIGAFTPEEIAAIVAEATEGLYTPEEVEKLVEEAGEKAVVVYKESDEYKKAMADAGQKAVDEYIASHPVKEDKTFFYGFVVVLVIAIALAVAFAYFYIIPQMKAKKAIEEQPKA
jgi:hypothetical protein